MTNDDPSHIALMVRLRHLDSQASLSPADDFEHALLVNWLATYSSTQRRCAKLRPEAFMDCLPRPDGECVVLHTHAEVGQC